MILLVGGPLIGHYAPNGVVMGPVPFPARLVRTFPETTPSQVIVQLRGIYPMIGGVT